MAKNAYVIDEGVESEPKEIKQRITVYESNLKGITKDAKLGDKIDLNIVGKVVEVNSGYDNKPYVCLEVMSISKEKEMESNSDDDMENEEEE